MTHVRAVDWLLILCVLLLFCDTKKQQQQHYQVGVTRFNMDGSASNHSVSTSNSPMMNRDVQQPFNQGEFCSRFSVSSLSFVAFIILHSSIHPFNVEISTGAHFARCVGTLETGAYAQQSEQIEIFCIFMHTRGLFDRFPDDDDDNNNDADNKKTQFQSCGIKRHYIFL